MSESSRRPLIGRILRNSSWNAIAYIWMGLLLFLLIPYIVHRIGTGAYGIWTLVLVVTGYSTLLDFGMGSALVKYIAEYATSDEPAELNKVVNNSLLFYAGLACLVLAIMLPLAGLFVRLFRVPPEMRETARIALSIGVGTYVLNTILMIGLSVMTGLQRMDLSNLVKVVMTIPRAIAIVIILRAGHGLIGLLLIDMGIAVSSVILAWMIVRRLLPRLAIGPRHLDRAVFGKMFRFGARLQASSVSELVNLHLDKLLISRFVGVQQVATYDLGTYVIARLRSFLAQVPSSLVPAVAEMSARGESETIPRLYRTGSKYVAFVATLAFGALIVTAPHIFRFWLGAGFERSARTMQILGLGYYMNVITVVSAYTSQGIGRPEYQMRAAIWQIAANAILSPVLIIGIGYFGGPIGTGIALVSGGVFFALTFARAMGIGGMSYLAGVITKPVAGAAVGWGAVAILRTLAPGWMDVGVTRAAAFWRWVAEAVLFGSIYLASLRLSRYFAGEEIAPIVDRLRNRFRRFSRVPTDG